MRDRIPDSAAGKPVTELTDSQVDQYLAGELPANDAQLIKREIEAIPEWRRYTQLLAAWLNEPDIPAGPSVLDALARFKDTPRFRNAVARNGTTRKQATRQQVHVVASKKGASGAIAALGTRTLREFIGSAVPAFLLGIVVTLAGWAAVAHHGSHRTADSVMTYSTAPGQRATITLPDGGTVTLNVASRLDVPLDYRSGNHTVRLVGEGLFTVPHRDGAPFTVLAGAIEARVLGTSFVVRRYNADSSTLVAVRDGKVSVGAAVVTANRLVEVGTSGVVHSGFADATPFSFATGVLTLDGLPFPAAIVELDRWYDADIRLGDPTLASRHVKGLFATGSLGDLAAILEWTYDVRVVRDGRVLTLYPR